MANQNTKRKLKKDRKEAGKKHLSREERRQRTQAKLIDYVQSCESELTHDLSSDRSLFDVHLREKKGHANIKIDLKFKEFKARLKLWLKRVTKDRPQEANLIRKAYDRVWERFNNKERLYKVVSKRIEEIGQQERQGVNQSAQELAEEHPGAYKRYTQQRSERACEVCYKEGRKKFKGKCEDCRQGEGKPEFAVMTFAVYYPKWRRLRRERRAENNSE